MSAFSLCVWRLINQSCQRSKWYILFSYHRTLRCCRLWPAWMNTLPGTKASSHFRLCCWWRWYRCCWCSHHRSNGLCSFHHFLTPRQTLSRGLSAPARKQKQVTDSAWRQDPYQHSRIKHLPEGYDTCQVAQWIKNLPEIQATPEIWVQFLGQEDPLEVGTPVFLPGEPHGQSSLAGYSP